MDLRQAAVIGAGTMGAGIAQVACQAGWRTRLYDAQAGALERGIQRIRDFWAQGVARGRTSPAEVERWTGLLAPTPSLEAAVGAADLIIEAVPEDLDLKRRVFAELDRLAPAHALLATNTSSLSIAGIAAATSRPGRVVGLHFFNPVPLMRLLEIVRHDRADEAAVEDARRVGAAMGKECIVVRDAPGFATSRLGIALGNEAARILDEGVASAEDIDKAMRLGYGHPMGPLELSDLVGLDVRHHITRYLHETLGGERWNPPKVTERLVARGELGKKTGKGFYDWSDGTARPRSDL